MRIALFGGSFNPIHNRHIELAEKVLKDNLADQVWIVPCGNHAFNKSLAPAKDRIEMINLSLKGNKNIRVEKLFCWVAKTAPAKRKIKHG